MKSIFWAILTFRSPILMTAIPGEHFLLQANNLLRTKGQSSHSLGLVQKKFFSIILSWKLMLLVFLGNDFQGLVCKSTFFVIHPYRNTWVQSVWLYGPIPHLEQHGKRSLRLLLKPLDPWEWVRRKWWVLPLTPWIVWGALERRYLWKVQEVSWAKEREGSLPWALNTEEDRECRILIRTPRAHCLTCVILKNEFLGR